MSSIPFRCPTCQNDLGGLPVSCSSCGHSLIGASGIADFVRRPELVDERAHYDEVYKAKSSPSARPLSEAVALWHQGPAKRDCDLIRRALPPLKDARVLLVGNGSSAKELAFLEWGVEALVFSDLSAWGVARNLAAFDLSDASDRLFPAAIDAEDLPFPDGSFDLVYGFAMVHHLPDVPRFLREARRVLRPGGKAVFFDDGFSPIWQWSKWTVLRPLMMYSHWKSGISPEDYRFTMQGGFRPKELASMIEGMDAIPWHHRDAFASYLWRRGVEKLAPSALRRPIAHSRLSRWVDQTDERLGKRLDWWRANQIRLAWGFTVPQQPQSSEQA